MITARIHTATSDDKAAAHSNKTYETLPALLLQNSDNLDGKAFPG